MKQKYFIDTNIFLRFLLNDHKSLTAKAEKYFLLANKNKAVLISSVLVISEVFWVLKSFYKYSIKNINKHLTSLLAHKNIQIKDKNLVLKTLNLCQKKNIAFVDAFCLLKSKQIKVKLITFDKKLLKLVK